MELRKFYDLVKHGRTAKVTYKPELSVHYYHVARIQRIEDWYAYQLQIYLMQEGKPDFRLSTSTQVFPTWDEALSAIGRQTHSKEWEIVDEQLDPFPEERLPVPRKE